MKTQALREFWSGFKSSFKSRLAVCIALFLSVYLFSLFTYPYLRLATDLSTLIFAELFVVFYFPFYWENFKLIFRNKSVEVPLPDEFSSLARKMGLKITKMKIFPNICNAYAQGNQVFVGQKLLEKLNPEEIKAVIAHEFGHIKGRHVVVQIVYILPIMAFFALSWSRLPPIMTELGLFAYMMFALVPIRWWAEKRADLAAIKQVGKEPLKSALIALVGKEKMNEPSETHPAVSQRIKWIDKAEI
jgi:Zn-dependent protease with chaperone function